MSSRRVEAAGKKAGRSSGGRSGRRRAARRSGRRRSQAAAADKYELYQKSVQEPDADVALVSRVFRRHFGREPRLLREDFCGTALLACRWVHRNAENRAWGIDLDPEPLAWGRTHNLSALEPEQASRVKLIQGDVRDIGHERVDVTVAFNFSYFLFLERNELLAYFRKARATLKREGIFVMDAYGGADAQRTSEEEREVEDFDYVWEQHSFDPIHHRATNFIHFVFPDGSRMNRAFRYDWRLWTLPEIRELLSEAGFAGSEVYWEGTTADDEPNGVFTRRERAPDDPAWVAYIVGIT